MERDLDTDSSIEAYNLFKELLNGPMNLGDRFRRTPEENRLIIRDIFVALSEAGFCVISEQNNDPYDMILTITPLGEELAKIS